MVTIFKYTVTFIYPVDAHAPASLLKLWYRELYEPLIPDALYAACVAAGTDFQQCSRALLRLPPINRLVSTLCCTLSTRLQLWYRQLYEPLTARLTPNVTYK